MMGGVEVDDSAARLVEVFDVLGPVYRRVFRAVERDVAVDGMSVGTRAVLDLLHRRGPMTVPQMGQVLALSRQFLQRTVNEAVDRSWVVSRANPAHRRSHLIELTPSGRATIATVAEREQAALGELGSDLSDDDVDGCLRVLRGLLARLDVVDLDE